MKLGFGKFKGCELKDVDPAYLWWLIENIDPTDAKNNGKNAYANKKLINEAQAVINAQDAGLVKPPQQSAPSFRKPAQTREINPLIKELKAYVQNIYDNAVGMQSSMDQFISDGEMAQQEKINHTPF